MYRLRQGLEGLVVSENDIYVVSFDAINMSDWFPITAPLPGSKIQVYYPDESTILYETEVGTSWESFGFSFFPNVPSGDFGFLFHLAGENPTMGLDAVSVDHFD